MKLITGANGFIGKALVVAYGDEALAVRRRSGRDSTHFSTPGAKQIVFDVSQPDKTAELVAALQEYEVDEVIHAAAITPWAPNPDFSIDLAMAQTLAEVCNRLRIPRLTFLSGWIVYDMQGDAPFDEQTAVGPTTDYGKSKLAVEEYFAKHLEHTVLVNARLASVYGPGQTSAGLIPNFVRAALGGEELRVASVKTRRDYLFIDDLAAALNQLSSLKIEQSTSINLGSGRAVGVGEVAKTIQHICQTDYQKDVRIIQADQMNEASPINNQLDITRAQSLGLLQQTTTLNDGLKAYIAWTMAQSHKESAK